jgi:hypothetical protein
MAIGAGRMSEPAHTLQTLSDEELLTRIATIDHLPTLQAYLEAEEQLQDREEIKAAILARVVEIGTKRPSFEERYMEVYRAIVEYKQRHDGVPPGLRELIELTSYASTSAVNYALEKLEEEGLIRRGGHYKKRKIEVVGARWLSPDEHNDMRYELEEIDLISVLGGGE